MLRIPSLLSYLLISIIVAASPLQAQRKIVAGDTVRILTSTLQFEGEVVSTSSDAVILHTHTRGVPELFTVPHPLIKRMEVRGPDRTVEESLKRGLYTGLLVTAVAALGVELMLDGPDEMAKRLEISAAIAIPVTMTLVNVRWGRKRWIKVL